MTLRVCSSGEGVWSNEGCVLAEGDLGYSVCRCTHLTNFAILMQVVPLEVRGGGALRVGVLLGSTGGGGCRPWGPRGGRWSGRLGQGHL